MIAAGWRVQSQTAQNSSTSAKRTGAGMAAGTVLLPGVGTVLGGMLGMAARKKGAITVVWECDQQADEQ